ncbi:hypothetical protein QTP88_010474 [Uroleucon formosanum]
MELNENHTLRAYADDIIILGDMKQDTVNNMSDLEPCQDPAKVPPSCEVIQVHITTSIFYKKRFKNEWIYVTNYDVIFITCDEDEKSTSYTLKGVDYKAEYMDFNPRSTIDRTRNTPYLQNDNLMEDYHVKTNKMDDLHTVSNSKKQLDSQSKVNNKINKLQDMQNINTILALRKYSKTNTEDLQEEEVQLNDKQAREHLKIPTW